MEGAETRRRGQDHDLPPSLINWHFALVALRCLARKVYTRVRLQLPGKPGNEELQPGRSAVSYAAVPKRKRESGFQSGRPLASSTFGPISIRLLQDALEVVSTLAIKDSGPSVGTILAAHSKQVRPIQKTAVVRGPPCK